MRHTCELPLSTPEAEGLPSGAIQAFLDILEAKSVPLHGLLVLRHGKIIAEGYWKPFHREYLHRIYSCSKSLVSIAIGFLEAEGAISLNDKIVAHFPEKLPPEGVHPYTGQATVRDLLMMASPHGKTTYKLMDLDDWVQTFFLYPPSHIPGTVFSYDTSATHVLGALVEKIAGEPFVEYLRPRMLDALGVAPGTRCLTDPVGTSWGGSGVLCQLRDLAKVALACMRGGEWNGRQLIPADYIRAATSPQISTFASEGHVQREYGYGYQFWCMPRNAFAFLGMGGQIALCLPEQDVVVATNADTQLMAGGEDIICDAVWTAIYPPLAGGECRKRGGAGPEALQTRLQNASLQTVQGQAHSSLMPSLDKQVYTLDANPLGWEWVSFAFFASWGRLAFHKGGRQHELEFGLGGNRPGHFPENGYDCLTSAAWWDDNTLNLACYITGEYFAPLYMTVYFKQDGTGDSVTLHLCNGAELFLGDYNGFASGYLRRL